MVNLRHKNFREVLILATSSITHNFVISDPAAIERFVQAIEESEREKATRQEKRSHNWKLLTDEQEILELMAKKKW